MPCDMDDSQIERATVLDSWTLSIEDIQERIETHYEPWDQEQKKWYRCKRNNNTTVCGQKAFFPHGVVAHENYHSIEAGDGPLIDQSSSNDTSSEGVPQTDHETADADGEIIKEIWGEFDDLE